MAELTLDISILIVDDSRYARATLKKELQNFGFWRIIEANDAGDALKVMQSEHVGLVFCDQQMPGMSGTELLHKVRRSQAFQKTPFVLITGHVDKQVVAECADYGGDAVIVKPFSPAVLEAKINAAFKERLHALHLDNANACVFSQLNVSKPGEPASLTKAASSLARESPKGLYKEGLALEGQGDLQAARQRQLAALRMEPHFIKAHDALARINEKSGELEKALEHTLKAVELSPGNYQRRYSLANLLIELGQREEAVKVLKQMMADGLGYPELLGRVAKAFLNCGLPEEAESACLVAVSLSPANSDLHKMLIAAYRSLDAQEKALAAAEKAIKEVAGSADLHCLYAELLLADGKAQQAKEQAEKALALDPAHAEARKLLGLGDQEG